MEELYQVIDDYLDHFISLADLEEWLAPRIPLFFQNPHSALADLAVTIEHGLISLENGWLDEESFRDELRVAASYRPGEK